VDSFIPLILVQEADMLSAGERRMLPAMGRALMG